MDLHPGNSEEEEEDGFFCGSGKNPGIAGETDTWRVCSGGERDQGPWGRAGQTVTAEGVHGGQSLELSLELWSSQDPET